MSDEKTRRIKLYTKKGDSGMTDLYGLGRRSKDNEIFNLVGGLDELSAFVGVAATSIRGLDLEILTSNFRLIQSILLDIGSNIVTPFDKRTTSVTKKSIEYFEKLTDVYSEKTPPLKEFILPGNCVYDSHIHVCRAVARRVERNFVFFKNLQEHLPESEQIIIEDNIMVFLNRISDYFFATARYVGLHRGKEHKHNDYKEFK